MFLANENIPRPSILLLRSANIPVASIQEDHPGDTDRHVLNLAIERKCILLTMDGDYGELVFRYKLENPSAIIYCRERGGDPSFIGRLPFISSQK